MKKKIVLSFLTQNRHKFLEAQEALKSYHCVTLEHLDRPKKENKDDSLSDPLKAIAIASAVKASKEYNRLVVAEDTGIFFEAYNDFPGMNTKWLINKIGYDGILRLLKGLNRAAYFRTVLALSKPNGTYYVFEGTIKGHIAEQICGADIDCMDYDRLFIPEGSDMPFSLMMENKRLISHRNIAFHNLGEFLGRSFSEM